MHLLLDLDGTLIDSSPGIYRAFSHACYEVGLLPPSKEAFSAAIGPPIAQVAKTFFPRFDTHVIERLTKAFRRDYDNKWFRMLTWHVESQKTLDYLVNDRKLTVSIVTNKPTSPSRLIVQEAGLEGLFQHIIGIDFPCLNGGKDAKAFKTKSESINFAVRLTGLNPDSCCYVGDTPSDLDAATRCNVTFIAATYGFHRWTDQQLAGCTAVSCFSQLPGILDQLNSLIVQSPVNST